MAVEYKLRGDASQLKKELQSVTAKEKRLEQQTIRTKQGFDKLSTSALRNENSLRRAKLATQKITAAELKFAASTKVATAGLVNQRRVTTGLAAKLGALRNQMLLFSFATIAMGSALKKAVAEASSLEESINAVNVVFKESATQVKEFGLTAAKSVGLSRSEFNKLATVTGALLKDTGIPLDQVAQKTVMLTKRAADMASVFDTDVRDALGAINSALRGQTEPITRYAADVTVATLQAFALSQGITKSVASMSQQEKRLLRVDAIMSQTQDTHDDFLNTQESLANIARITSAAMSNLAANIGNDLVPSIVTALGILDRLIGNIEKIRGFAKDPGFTFGKISDEDAKRLIAQLEGPGKKGAELLREFQDIMAGGQEQRRRAQFAIEAGKKLVATTVHLREEAELRSAALAENFELLKSQVVEVKEIVPEMANQSSIMRDQNNHTLAQLEHFERLAELMGDKLPADAQKMLDILRAQALTVPELPKNLKIASSAMKDAAVLGQRFADTIAQAVLHTRDLKSVLLSLVSTFVSFGISQSFKGFPTISTGGAPLPAGGGGISKQTSGAPPINRTPLTTAAPSKVTVTFNNTDISDFSLLTDIGPRIAALVENGRLDLPASRLR